MLPLRVRVLGGLAVDGVESTALGSRKQRRLLARLVVARGAVVANDALVDDLWGTAQPANPRHDLAVLVSRLRSALPAGELVQRDGGYALDVAWTDLAHLLELQRGATVAAAQERWPEAAEAARAAVALVRGPVLPEHADADWVGAVQASVDVAGHEARLVLARAELAVGDPRLAADLAREALSASPYDEVALRLHLEACLAAHAPSLGIGTYAVVRERLAEELGTDPAPETVAVYEALLRATRTQAPSGQASASAAALTSAPAPAVDDERPTTRYVRTSDGVYIAYQVSGSGPVDVLFNVGLLSHVEAAWDIPGKAHFFRRLASFCRLIRFDKRGSGLSDPVSGPTTLEQRTEDMRAVLDAVGSTRTALLGISEGGAMSVLFAATYPGRTSALVLYGTGARGSSALGYPYGLEPAVAEGLLEEAVSSWGTQDDLLIHMLAPSVAHDEQVRLAFARYERLAASPGQFHATTRMNIHLDVRAVLPAVQTPTLVLHREEEVFFEVGHARYLADSIPGAALKVLPGSDHMFWVEPDQIVDEIEAFLLGARRARAPERVLSTILVTDVVGADDGTGSADSGAWRDVLDLHDRLVRHHLEQCGGRPLDVAAGRSLSSFDGPAAAVRCAQSVVALVHRHGLQVRAGVHTGECEVRGAGLDGIALRIAAGVTALAGPDEVLVTSTVRDLVLGSGIELASRGELPLDGHAQPWRVFRATAS